MNAGGLQRSCKKNQEAWYWDIVLGYSTNREALPLRYFTKQEKQFAKQEKQNGEMQKKRSKMGRCKKSEAKCRKCKMKEGQNGGEVQ